VNAWPAYKPVVTVVDVLEAGACIDGVYEYIASNGGDISAHTDKHAENGWILSASNGNGDGDGDGNGYGDGNGDGNGYGDGFSYR